jgi:hypothetical protein
MRQHTFGLLRLFLFATVAATALGTATSAQAQYSYFTLTPCRVVDTRNANSTNGGPLLGTTARTFAIKGACGVPSTAKAVTINIAVTGASATNSWLTVWPAGGTKPNTAAINFSSSDWALSNGAIVGLGQQTLELSVQNAVGQVHVIIDVTGYFQ